ncbi:MAG: alpha/beta hydrolase [Pseudohongiellaceae bacterium]
MYLQKPQPQPGPEGVTLPMDGYSGNEGGGCSGSISVGGRRIAYSEFGAPGGFPLLYCHQYGGSRLEASALESSACRRGFRIVAVDRPGLGGSDYADTGQTDPSGDLVALADALGLPSYGLLAWGGGAGYALEAAQHDPGRVRFCLMLSCPSLWMDGEKGWMQAILQRALQWRCRLAARWTPPARRLALLDRVAGPSDHRLLRQAGVQRWLRESLGEAARQGSRGLAQDVAGGFRRCRFNPERLELPVEFWYGASDRMVSECGGRRLVLRMPRARLRRLCGAGHFFFLRHQDVLFDRLTVLAGPGGRDQSVASERDVSSPSGDSRALVA